MTLKTGRSAWVGLGKRLLAEGRHPADVTLLEAAGMLGVTKGSFNNYYGDQGGAEGWYAEIIDAWAEQRIVPGGPYMPPLAGDRLQALRKHAQNTSVSDQAMRNWAATAVSFRPQGGAVAAAAALRAAREPLVVQVTAALADLGLEEEADLWCRVLIREFGLGPGDPSVPLDDAIGFTRILSRLGAPVRDDLMTGMETTVEGRDGGSLVVVFALKGKQPDEAELRRQAMLLRDRLQQSAEPSAAADGS